MPVFLFDHTTNDEVRPLHTQKEKSRIHSSAYTLSTI